MSISMAKRSRGSTSTQHGNTASKPCQTSPGFLRPNQVLHTITLLLLGPLERVLRWKHPKSLLSYPQPELHSLDKFESAFPISYSPVLWVSRGFFGADWPYVELCLSSDAHPAQKREQSTTWASQ